MILKRKMYNKLLALKQELNGKEAFWIDFAKCPDEVYKQILGDKLNMNDGMLYENTIAQTLQREVQGSYRFQ